MASDEWRGVHPASVLVNLVPRLWALVRNVWPLLLAVLAGGVGREGIADAVIVGLFFAYGLASSTIHAITLRYRVVGGRLEIRSGLLDRQARVVPIERIQNVSLVRNVFQRLSGLVEVQIETASGREAEGLLSAITVERANELIGAISTNPRREETETEAVLVESGILDLVWAGASDLRLGAVAVILGVIVEVAPQYSVEAEAMTRALSGLVGVLTVIALVSGGWLVGIGSAILRGYGFRLVQTSRALVAERGLFTRRRAEIVLTKIQLLTWTEPVLLRLNGLGSLSVETAAARPAGPGTERSEVVVPVLDEEQVRHVAAATLGPEVDPTAVDLHPAHPLALRRALVGVTVRWLVFVGLGALLFGPWVGWAALGLPVAWFLARMDIVRQGWRLTEHMLISRYGWWTRQTAVLLRDKVQSVEVHQGPALRVLGLARAIVRVAGSRVALPLLALDDARAVQAELIRGTRRTIGGNPGRPVEIPQGAAGEGD